MEGQGAIPCVIYAAKSTEDKYGSIPDQLRECREAIEADPRRRFIGEYKDEAFSAYTGNRGPDLAEAMAHAEDLAAEHGVAELWAQHSDRIARGDGRAARHTVEIALWALKADVRVRTLQDPDTFRDLLYAVVTGQRNHEDSLRKSQSVQAGRRRAAARGNFLGYVPDGYRVEVELSRRGELTKRLEVDPRRREILSTLFALALRGARPAAVAAELNARGWLSKTSRYASAPKRWTAHRVMEILANPRYAALAQYNGQTLARGHWPAYLTESEHLKLRAIVSTRRPTKAPRQLESYLLAKLASCHRCGGPLLAATGLTHHDGTFARRYKCRSHWRDRGPGRCPVVAIEAELLEATFVSSLRLLLLENRDLHRPPAGVMPAARRELIEAARAGDEERTDSAIEAQAGCASRAMGRSGALWAHRGLARAGS